MRPLLRCAPFLVALCGPAPAPAASPTSPAPSTATASGTAAEPAAATSPAAPTLLGVRKIWDAAPHNAFTDLVRFKGRWFCAFREGSSHVSADGALRVLTSADADSWESAARVTSPDGDLRDAKLTVTPGGRLMLSGAVALRQSVPPAAGEARHRSMVWISDDGKTWSDPRPVGADNDWVWRTTFRDGVGYGIGYRTVPPPGVRLYATRDEGRTYQPLVDRLAVAGRAGEHDLNFAADGSVVCLLRRDVPPAAEADALDPAARAGLAVIGRSKPPYTEWEWKDAGVKIGGPAMIRLPDDRLLAVVRLHDKKVRTSLCWVDQAAGRLTECLALPSGGDCSYAGLAIGDDGRLRVSYYSSHEGKASIYLATIALPRP
ncbi:MAG: hypothetical protein JWO31_2378 [Phycisphaerales bacterium]|nr:hypothetical protein [Phycisphaerales bacterium]